MNCHLDAVWKKTIASVDLFVWNCRMHVACTYITCIAVAVSKGVVALLTNSSVRMDGTRVVRSARVCNAMSYAIRIRLRLVPGLTLAIIKIALSIHRNKYS